MRRLFVILHLIAFFLASLHAQFRLPKGVKDVLDKKEKAEKTLKDFDPSEEDEIALGKGISDKICAVYGVQQDVNPTRYVTLVGSVVAEQSSRPKLQYQFIILDSDVVNAFAAPGGFIHVTRGALASMKSEAELAGVLGHEITHVTEKHTIKSVQKAKGFQLVEGQTSLRTNPEILGQLVDKMTDSILQGFGQPQELEADRVGMRIAFKAGYDPSGLVAFLETLKGQNQGSSTRAGLFASHPATQERIDKLQAQVSGEKLFSQAAVSLPARFTQFIKYEVKAPSDAEASVAGAKGLTDSDKKKDDKDKDKDKEEKSRFSLKGIKNPLASGEKRQTAEVTGAGGARGVGKEKAGAESSGKPKNPSRVTVPVSKDDVKKFKEAGKLQ